MTICYDLKVRAVDSVNLKKDNITKLSKIFNISRKSLYNWRNGKYINENTIKESKFTPEIKCCIRQYVLKRCNFDYRLLIKFIKKKFSVTISKSSIYNLLKNMKIIKKKIYKKTILAKKLRLKNLTKKFKDLIKNISLNDIISVDESSIDTHIHSDKGWSVKGHKKVEIQTNNRIRYTLTCAINYGNIFENQIIKNSANAMTFLDFIKSIVSKLPTNKKTYILLDNARIHHARIVKEYLSQLNHIQFIYNVPYSPEYNPIERVFSELKMLIRQKNITNANIIKVINSSLKKVKSKNIIAYYSKSLSIT